MADGQETDSGSGLRQLRYYHVCGLINYMAPARAPAGDERIESILYLAVIIGTHFTNGI